MRVKSCIASDGAGHLIQLSDEYGCVLRPKMISRFLKARAPDERATVITYAFFHAFKFPDALSVHIKCKVEICRHGCLDHCQLHGNAENEHERKDTIIEKSNNGGGGSNEGSQNNVLISDESDESSNDDRDDDADVFYDDIIHRGDDMAAIGGFANSLGLTQRIKQTPVKEPISDMDTVESLFMKDQPLKNEMLKNQKKDEKFPQGPRFFEAEDRLGIAVAGPRSLNLDDEPVFNPADIHPVYKKEEEDDKTTTEKKTDRKRRSIYVPGRSGRSADVGVSGIYDVISEADLAFSPDTKQEAVTVFQGQITEDVVYGICMPVPGFSVLFILVTSATIVSALVAGSLLYRYQLQKETLAHQKQQQSESVNHMAVNTIGSWMTLRLFKMRHCNSPQHTQQTQ